MHYRLEGLIAATFTPIDGSGSVNLGAVAPMVDQLIAEGVTGLYVCGSTGEGLSLTGAERREVAAAFIEAADGRVPVVVQVGHNSLAEAAQLADHARQAGADVISDYPFKTRCCGASQMMTMPSVGVDLVALLLEDAEARGADVIAVACPLCQFNLEGYQGKVMKKGGLKKKIPILYFTQLIGLAMGLDHKKLGLQRSFISVKPALARRSSDD